MFVLWSGPEMVRAMPIILNGTLEFPTTLFPARLVDLPRISFLNQ